MLDALVVAAGSKPPWKGTGSTRGSVARRLPGSGGRTWTLPPTWGRSSRRSRHRVADGRDHPHEREPYVTCS